MRFDKVLGRLIESAVNEEHPVHAHVRTALDKFNHAGNSGGAYEAVHEFKCDAPHSHVVDALRQHAKTIGGQNSLTDNEHMSPDPGMAHSTTFTGSGEVPGAFTVDSDHQGNHQIWSRENRD